MFNSIKTSKENKIVVTELSRKFNLGAETLVGTLN